LLYCYVFVMFGLFQIIQMCQALHQGNWAKIRKETIGLQVRSHLSRVLSRVLNTAVDPVALPLGGLGFTQGAFDSWPARLVEHGYVMCCM
jgi:hypothetical protein